MMDGPQSIRDASRLRFKLPSPSIISAFTSSFISWPRSSTERSEIAEHFQFETLLRPPPSQPLPMFHWFHDGARGRYCTFILHHRQAGRRRHRHFQWLPTTGRIRFACILQQSTRAIIEFLR